MEEVRAVSEKKQLISQITDVMINKIEEYFKLQIEKGTIRKVDSRSLALMCFSVLFQSIILSKVYDKNLAFDSNHYADDMLDILFEGIRP